MLLLFSVFQHIKNSLSVAQLRGCAAFSCSYMMKKKMKIFGFWIKLMIWRAFLDIFRARWCLIFQMVDPLNKVRFWFITNVGLYLLICQNNPVYRNDTYLWCLSWLTTASLSYSERQRYKWQARFEDSRSLHAAIGNLILMLLPLITK